MISFEEFGEAFGLVVDDGSREFDTREEAEEALADGDPREIYYDFNDGKYKLDSWDEYYSTH